MVVAYQTKREADWLFQKMRDFNFGGSILEIGSHGGGFLALMAYNTIPGTKIRSIDLTDRHGLNDTIQKLKDSGYDAEVFIGDSKSPEAIYWAATNGPYDFVFIDGEHSYRAVEADFRNYGPMGRWVGFHDIKEKQPFMGVVEFWEEIKTKYPSMEYSVRPDWNGIGLLHMPPYGGEKFIHASAAEIEFNAS